MTFDLSSMSDDQMVDLVQGFAKTAPRKVNEDYMRILCAAPEAPPEPLWGVTVPGWAKDPWAELSRFTDVVAPQVLHPWPAGKPGAGGLDQAFTCADRYPGVPLMVNVLCVGRLNDAERINLADTAQRLARKTGHRLTLVPDNEPERRDYTAGQYVDEFHRIADAMDEHAPDVDLVVGFGGYRLTTYVEAYATPLLGRFRFLGTNPYAKDNPGQVQARMGDLDDANDYCATHGLRVTWCEVGAVAGDGQGDRLRTLVDRAKTDRPAHFPYFHGLGGVGDSRLAADLLPLYRDLTR